MPRPSFDDAASLPDPFMIYNFNMVFDRIPGGFGDIRDLSFKVQTTMLPGMQIDPVTVPYRGTELNFAGRQVYSKSIDIQFLEVRDISTRDAFRAWVEFARNNNTNTGSFKRDYSVFASLELYDDIPNIVRVIRMEGMFPTNLGDMGLDGGQSAAGQLQMTFSYDRHFDV